MPPLTTILLATAIGLAAVGFAVGECFGFGRFGMMTGVVVSVVLAVIRNVD